MSKANHAALLLAFCASLCACSSGGGIFQPPKSSGKVVATLTGSTAPLSTSFASPQPVNGAFSVKLAEGNYSATFTATIVSYTAPTTGPCYTVTMDGTGTIATFTPKNASPTSGSSTAPSPCQQLGTDIEGVLFKDQQMNGNEQFFENLPVSTQGGIVTKLLGAGSPLPATSPSQPLIVNNAFAISLSEAGYSGPFTAAIASYTAPVAMSCYTVTMDATGTIATLAPRSEPSLSGGASNACTPPNNDVESVIFQDTRGNSATVSFENVPASAAATLQAVLQGTSTPLATTMASPQHVNGGFSVALSEPNSGYPGPYSATIVSFTAHTTGPCYTVALDPTKTVAIFTPTNAAALNGSTPSPCSQPGTDVEGVLFEDLRGSFNEQFFSN